MKTCDEIYGEMLGVFEENTGFSMSDSADLSVRLYGAAAQLESLYGYCDWSVNQSFPQTASDIYLDYHGQLRGLTRKDGEVAAGMIRFTTEADRTQSLTIPAGTACTTAGLVRFVTTSECVISATATTGDAAAVAESIGVAGNAAAGTITSMPSPPTGVLSCTNVAAFSGGSDQEVDDDFRTRILDSYARLPNGANAAFYQERALAIDGVAAATVIPRVNGVGTVAVAIAPESGLPSSDLIAQVQADLEEAREIATVVTVVSPTVVTQNFTVTLYPKTTSTYSEVSAAVTGAMNEFFTGERLGQSILLAEIGNLIYSTGLVTNYTISVPSADVSMDLDDLPTLGTLTLKEGS
ncbi:MAG: baseplate J/gp47 family protein [Eubacteriales bacterium]